MTHNLIAGGMGGNLARGFIDAEYNANGWDSEGMDAAIEPILEQVGEAYFSLMPQQVERSNLFKGSEFGDVGAEVHLFVTVSRLAGAHFGWLAVLGLLLLGTLIGTIRTCVGSRAVDFEAQDAVKLFQSTLSDANVCDTSRARYREGIQILSSQSRVMLAK